MAADLRPFPARLDAELYAELKRRADLERKSMNALLNEALETHLRGAYDARATLLRALAVIEGQGR